MGGLDRIPLQTGEAGAIFLIEVLEHLTSDFATKAFAEFRRVFRVGEHLIVTVPNEEDLGANLAACPDNECVFHRVEHVQSFSVDSLAQVMRTAGFDVVFATGPHLEYFRGTWLARSLGRVRHRVRMRAAGLADTSSG